MKGEGTGQASFYTSFTDCATEGTIRIETNGPAIPVRGKSWFDHEFGSNQLALDQEGWDWFSLHLSDGSDVMLYRLRKKGGLTEPVSSGTFINPDGSAQHLSLSDFSLVVLDHWESPRSEAPIPASGIFSFPRAALICWLPTLLQIRNSLPKPPRALSIGRAQSREMGIPATERLPLKVTLNSRICRKPGSLF